MKTKKSRSEQLRINSVILAMAGVGFLFMGDSWGFLFLVGSAIAVAISFYFKAKEGREVAAQSEDVGIDAHVTD